MNLLKIIIANEYITDVKAKSFWLSTIIFPIAIIGFGIFIGFLAADSDSLTSVASMGQDPKDDLSGSQVAGMMIGVILCIFLMVYGAMIFQKVRVEKCNRIIEILATCVDGRTMMLAKVISVGLVGLTQILIWSILLGGGAFTLFLMFGKMSVLASLITPKFFLALMWGIIYFVGGYIFFGSIFAAIGAMTDKNNENQEYVSIVTMLIMASMYIGMFAVDNGGSTLSFVCGILPFTSPSVGAVNAISGAWPLWLSILSVVVLYGSAAISIALAGKIYTSSLLLKGKKLTPKDLVAFMRAK